MIVLGGGNIATEHAGYVAMTLSPTGTTAMDTDNIAINPTMTVANGVPKVSATVSIPAGTLSSGISRSSNQIDQSGLVETKSVTANGTYAASDKLWNQIVVNVPDSGSDVSIQSSKTATLSTANNVTVTPDPGYDAMATVVVPKVQLEERSVTLSSSQTLTPTGSNLGFSKVTVTVTSGGGATANIQDTKTIDNSTFSQALLNSTSNTITFSKDDAYDAMSNITMDVSNVGWLNNITVYDYSTLPGADCHRFFPGNHQIYKIEGRMASNGDGSATLTATANSKTLSTGYYSGGTIAIGTNSSTPTVTTNGTINTYDDSGNYYNSITINVPTSSSSSASLTNFTLSSNTEAIFENSSKLIPSKDFSIDSIINGYTIKPPYKGSTSISGTYDGIEFVNIPPLANWTNAKYLVDLRDSTAAIVDPANVVTGAVCYQLTADKILEQVTGTMVNHGAVSKTFTGPVESYTIPAGYHNGAGTVSVNLSMNAYYVGATAPGASLGNDGDIYLKT